MNYQDKSLQSLKLGQATEYAANYDRTLLQPVPRKLNRDGLGITEQQPFSEGADIWTAYEISWLNPKGLPQVAIADVEIDYRSENLIESKSFKLYLNSFNQSKFADFASVERTMREDLSACAQGAKYVCILYPIIKDKVLILYRAIALMIRISKSTATNLMQTFCKIVRPITWWKKP